MKHKKHSPGQNPASAAAPVTAAPLNQNEINFVPASDEVARRAYFSYVNQGASDGHEVQHWLGAERQMLAERNLTRTHGIHNQTSIPRAAQ